MVARSSIAAGNESLRPESGDCLVSDLTCGSTTPSSSRSHRRLASAARLRPSSFCVVAPSPLRRSATCIERDNSVLTPRLARSSRAAPCLPCSGSNAKPPPSPRLPCRQVHAAASASSSPSRSFARPAHLEIERRSPPVDRALARSASKPPLGPDPPTDLEARCEQLPSVLG